MRDRYHTKEIQEKVWILNGSNCPRIKQKSVIVAILLLKRIYHVCWHLFSFKNEQHIGIYVFITIYSFDTFFTLHVGSNLLVTTFSL